jgi:acyl carrier protein
MNTVEKVRNFIVDELRWDGARDELTDDYPLLDSGVVDSLGLFQVVEFLEDECGVEIGADEILPENFATLGAIDRLVRGHA